MNLFFLVLFFFSPVFTTGHLMYLLWFGTKRAIQHGTAGARGAGAGADLGQAGGAPAAEP